MLHLLCICNCLSGSGTGTARNGKCMGYIFHGKYKPLASSFYLLVEAVLPSSPGADPTGFLPTLLLFPGALRSKTRPL